MIRIPVQDSENIITELVFPEPVSASEPAIGERQVNSQVLNSFTNQYITVSSDVTVIGDESDTIYEGFYRDGYTNIIRESNTRRFYLNNGYYLVFSANDHNLHCYDSNTDTEITSVSISSTQVYGGPVIYFPALSMDGNGNITDVERIHIQKLNSEIFYQVVVDRFNSVTDYNDTITKWNTILNGSVPQPVDVSVTLSTPSADQGDTITATVDISNHEIETDAPIYLRTPRGIVTVTDADEKETDNEYDYWIKYYDFTTSTGSIEFSVFITENSEIGTYIDIFASVDPLQFTVSERLYIRGTNIAETETGGGTGTYDWTSDSVPEPQGPGVNIGGTTLVSAYLVTPGMLTVLHTTMWNPTFWEGLQSTNVRMLDALVSLHIIPWTPVSLYSENIFLGAQDTQIASQRLGKQIDEFDLGTIDIDEFYGSFLDYGTHTSITITLPFIGERELDVNTIMGKKLGIKYFCDSYTGDVLAFISVNGVYMWSFAGSASMSIPASANDYSRRNSGMLAMLTSIPAIGLSAVTGGGLGMLGGAAGFIGGAVNATAPPQVVKQGNISTATGLTGFRFPFITISSPRQAIAKNQYNIIGGATRRGGKLRSFKGFTQVENAHVENINCTADEQQQILNYLRGGVIA